MTYIARFRRVPADADFKDKTIVVPISVGQEYHHGEKFHATMKRIGSQPFSHCTILVADTLQRHNYQLLHGGTEPDAASKTYDLGTQWIENNRDAFALLSMPSSIVRWDSCLQHATFQSHYEKVATLTETDKAYGTALELNAHDFVQRHKARNSAMSAIDHTLLKRMCMAYIIEETAAIYSYFVDHGYHYVAYPSNAPASIDLFINKYVHPKSPDLIQWLYVSFEKKEAR